jgi:hypothetical protein
MLWGLPVINKTDFQSQVRRPAKLREAEKWQAEKWQLNRGGGVHFSASIFLLAGSCSLLLQMYVEQPGLMKGYQCLKCLIPVKTIAS